MSVTLEVQQTIPLIYTANGNVPESSLKYSYNWIDGPEQIVFTEVWHDTAGEIVKKNVHMYARNGISMTGEQHKG